ncbi:MAG: A/G-specific adenine glycosylase [Planctomycetales bacterium]|nr:A/G-specific adenine glycosylase [Planctomycetales bacterium]
MPPRRKVAWASRLLAWYRRARRALPWRRTRDPYRIWVSEVMLQQTTVATVTPYWRRFLRRFPTVRALARAEEDEVLVLWSGLGYYSRARNLHRAAREIVSRHGGRFPRTLDAALALPGIGRYTAGAVLSIAYGVPLAVVDGNVARVLARLFLVRGDPRSPRAARRLWTLADSLVPAVGPGDWNQALMELGATLCAPDSPRCAPCPVRSACRAHRAGLQEKVPSASPRPKTVAVEETAALLRRDGAVLLVQRPGWGLLGGLWDLPAGKPESLARRYRVGLTLGQVRHAILNRRITRTVVEAEARRGVRLEGRWVPLRDLPRLPLAGAARKALAAGRIPQPRGADRAHGGADRRDSG